MHLHQLTWRSVAGGRREWLGRLVQSHPAQRSQAFSCCCSLFFLFATTSNLPLSSYSNKTIICSNKKWENGGGHLQDTRTLGNPIHCVNKVKSAGFLLPCHSEGFASDTSEVFNKRRRNFFTFFCRRAGKNQRHVLPRLLNICIIGRALSESCYFCLGDSAGDEARKKHRLQVFL